MNFLNCLIGVKMICFSNKIVTVLDYHKLFLDSTPYLIMNIIFI